MSTITSTAVLGGLNNGSRSIWDLAALFHVPAADTDLNAAIRKLVAAGTVTASDPNIYSATLEVAR